MPGIVAILAALVAFAGCILLGIVVTGSLRRDLRNYTTIIVLGSIVAIVAGATTSYMLTSRQADQHAAIVERIEVAYGVTVNDAGSFDTKSVSRWEIDGNLMRCFFTSSDMNDKNLMLFCKHWNAADSAEFLTPNNLKHQ